MPNRQLLLGIVAAANKHRALPAVGLAPLFSLPELRRCRSLLPAYAYAKTIGLLNS